MFESVDARTDARTHGRTDARTPARVPSYKLTLWAFGSGELKIFLLRNQKANDLESWYASSVAWVLPKFAQMMTLGWPWPILRQGQSGSLCFLYGKKVKLDFSETIAVYNLKLATDDRSDKKFLLTSKLCPLGGLYGPAPGLYTCIKSWKKCIKSDFKEISLKLVTNG